MSSLLTSDLARVRVLENVCVTVSVGGRYVCVRAQMVSSPELSRYLSPLSNHFIYSPSTHRQGCFLFCVLVKLH